MTKPVRRRISTPHIDSIARNGYVSRTQAVRRQFIHEILLFLPKSQSRDGQNLGGEVRDAIIRRTNRPLTLRRSCVQPCHLPGAKPWRDRTVTSLVLNVAYAGPLRAVLTATEEVASAWAVVAAVGSRRPPFLRLAAIARWVPVVHYFPTLPSDAPPGFDLEYRSIFPHIPRDDSRDPLCAGTNAPFSRTDPIAPHFAQPVREPNDAHRNCLPENVAG